MKWLIALSLFCSLPVKAKEMIYDRDTAIIIWRCGSVDMADKARIAIDPKAKPELPEYCVSIGRSIGEVPPEPKQ